MNKFHVFLTPLLFSLILIFFVGCAPMGGYTKVPAGINAYVLKGYSLAPPSGNGWYVQMLGESSIVFKKITEQAQYHTYVAQIIPFDIPIEIKSKEKFLEIVNESFEIQRKESASFEVLELNIALDNRFADFSVRSHDVVKDFRARNIPSGANYLIMDTYNYYIKHPKLQKYFRIAYSERSLPGEISKTIKEDAERFFSSIRIIMEEK